MNGGREVLTRSSLLSAARILARLGPAGARIQVMTADRLYLLVYSIGEFDLARARRTGFGDDRHRQQSSRSSAHDTPELPRRNDIRNRRVEPAISALLPCLNGR